MGYHTSTTLNLRRSYTETPTHWKRKRINSSSIHRKLHTDQNTHILVKASLATVTSVARPRCSSYTPPQPPWVLCMPCLPHVQIISVYGGMPCLTYELHLSLIFVWWRLLCEQTVVYDDQNLLHVHSLGVSKLWRVFSVRRADLCLPCHTPVLSVPLAMNWVSYIIDVLYRMYTTAF